METENLQNTEVQEVSVIETELAKANVTDQVIEKLKSDYLGLKINGIEDKEGFKKLDRGRKDAKALRSLATNICKTGREKAIQEQKDWISAEKKVVAKISEVEDYCQAECDKILAEQQRILFEAAQQKKLPARKEKLMTLGVEIEDAELLKINDDQFTALFNEFHQKHLEAEAEKIRIEKAKIEAEKKEAERKENERLAEEKRQKELAEAAEKARIEAEQKAKAEIERKEREAAEAIEKANKAKAEAEIKAKQAAEKAEKEKQAAIERAEREKQAAIESLKRKQKEDEEARLKAEKEAAEKLEAEKQEAIEAELRKGDQDKMADLIVSLNAIKTKYTFKSKKHQKLYSDVGVLIDKITNHIIEKQ